MQTFVKNTATTKPAIVLDMGKLFVYVIKLTL